MEKLPGEFLSEMKTMLKEEYPEFLASYEKAPFRALRLGRSTCRTVHFGTHAQGVRSRREQLPHNYGGHPDPPVPALGQHIRGPEVRLHPHGRHIRRTGSELLLRRRHLTPERLQAAAPKFQPQRRRTLHRRKVGNLLGRHSNVRHPTDYVSHGHNLSGQ